MKPIEQLKALKLEQLRVQYPSVPDYALSMQKYSDKSANALTRCVLDWLQLNGWQAERINTMGRPIDKRQQVTDVLGRTKTIGSMTWGKSTATKGSADISATIKGRSVKIEIKYGKDRQSQEQKKYQEMIEQSEGIYLIVRTFDDLFNWYNEFIETTK
jgi:hypothetical protein